MTIWMVERKQGEIWVPLAMKFNRAYARYSQKFLQSADTSRKYRVRKYTRVEETQ